MLNPNVLGLECVSDPIHLDLVDCQSKYTGLGIRAGPTLPWTWPTTKSKCIGYGTVVGPTIPWTCPMASPCMLGLACMQDLYYLGPGRLPSPSTVDLPDC